MTRTPSAKATRNMEISEDVDNVTKGFYGMNAPRSHSILTMRNGRDGEVRTHYGLSVPVPPCLHGNPNTNLGSGISQGVLHTRDVHVNRPSRYRRRIRMKTRSFVFNCLFCFVLPRSTFLSFSEGFRLARQTGTL